MKFILGRKIKMTQIFDENGNLIPVTEIIAGPCVITQVKKDNEQDGYNAVQLGFSKKKNLSKSLKGHFKGLGEFRFVREFRIDDSKELKRGDVVKVNTFTKGDKVKVVGVSKGKGFQGVVKRHGFSGAPKTHGHKDQERMPGSIGCTGPARVFKGLRMAGHMGSERVTVKNLEIIKIDEDNDLIYIKGAVPGAKESLLLISGLGEIKVNVESAVREDEDNSSSSSSSVKAMPTGRQVTEDKKVSQDKGDETNKEILKDSSDEKQTEKSIEAKEPSSVEVLENKEDAKKEDNSASTKSDNNKEEKKED